MPDMPFDILNQRLGKLRDSGLLEGDNTALAMDIDTELQEKFIFFPIAELDALIKDIREPESGTFHLGDGPEKCSAQSSENPNWLYNHAENALALWWHLKRKAEKLAQRPEPGIYRGKYIKSWFTVIVTEDRRIMIPQQMSSRVMDCTDDYDNRGHAVWKLQRINVTDGTVSA